MNHRDIAYLIDGSGYIFRAFYAVNPNFTNKEGFPTNALFGFTRMLVKLLNECGPANVIMVFDSGRETFRTELYDQYKAHREECPPELLKQMPFFRDIAKAFGLPIWELAGYEADDLIGTLAKRFNAAGVEVVVVSGDKDLMQLVSDKVSIWDTMKDQRYKAEDVKAKLGVYPDKVVELLGLMGDSSDNIPGLSGVGPKTAVQLIEKYGDVEGVIASVQALKTDKSIRGREKIAQQIESDPEILRLSRKLAQVDCNVPLTTQIAGAPVELSKLEHDEMLAATSRVPADGALLQALVDKFDFQSLVRDLKLDGENKPKIQAQENYRTVFASGFEDWLLALKKVDTFSFDLETTSLDVLSAKVVGVSFCWNDEEAWYIPFAHRESPEPQVAWSSFVERCGGILESPAIKKIGQNLKYDIGVLAQQGIEVQGVSFDTMVAAYLVHPDRNDYNLTTLAQQYLGKTVIEYEEVVPKGENFTAVAIDQATVYACQDAHYAWLLRAKLQPALDELGVTAIFNDVETPLISVLSQMERRGVKLDLDLLAKMSEEFAAQIEILQRKVFELAGGEFNLNSPKQLADILFNKLGISTKGLKKTKTGISTDSSVLEKLADQHELPGEILKYRLVHKLKSTYVDALPAQVSAYTQRLHSRFNQTVTATGRLSSSDPNLQNIPVQSAEGQRIRSAFIAEPEYLLVSADYSQIELRVLAHMSGDENFIQAFNDGIDIHSRTAREILGLDEHADITPDMRRMGKTINFGVVYGMSGFRLARDLGIPVGVANQYIDNYFGRYPRIKEFFAELEKEIDQKGYVSTILGRKRRTGDIDSSDRDAGFVRRAALNAPIQGSAADIIKLAMIKIDRLLRSEGLPAAMIMQIHDELVFEVHQSAQEQVIDLVRREMEGVIELRVPLKVDIGWGKNWQEAQS